MFPKDAVHHQFVITSAAVAPLRLAYCSSDAANNKLVCVGRTGTGTSTIVVNFAVRQPRLAESRGRLKWMLDVPIWKQPGACLSCCSTTTDKF